MNRTVADHPAERRDEGAVLLVGSLGILGICLMLAIDALVFWVL
jgi:hypothetical protein